MNPCTGSQLCFDWEKFDPKQTPEGVDFEATDADFSAVASTQSADKWFTTAPALALMIGILAVPGWLVFCVLALFEAFFVWDSLMVWAGKITVIRTGDHGSIFTGVGSIGRKRMFRWSRLRSVTEEFRKGTKATTWFVRLTFDRGPTIDFGHYLNAERRSYLEYLVRSQLVTKDV